MTPIVRVNLSKHPDLTHQVIEVAIETPTETHARIRREDWLRITGMSETDADGKRLTVAGGGKRNLRHHQLPRVGDHYEAIIKRETGATKKESCGCDALKNQMNAWGPDGCRDRRDEIISETIANAHGHSIKYKLGLIIPGLELLAGHTIGLWLDEAIKKAES